MEPNKKSLSEDINAELFELMDEENDFGLTTEEEFTNLREEERKRLDEDEMNLIDSYYFSDEQE